MPSLWVFPDPSWQLSHTLQIQLPTVGPDHSSSDSSDFSSEDDSTVVLVKTGSRSPSPRRSKHKGHHSRSGSSSPEQAKVKAPGGPADDGSPADILHGESTSCPPEGSNTQAFDPPVEAKESMAKESGPWCKIRVCAVCHRSYQANCCVFGSLHPLKCVFSTRKRCMFSAILFQEQPLVCPGGLTLTLPSVRYICANYIYLFFIY